jgi:thioredoxin
MTLLMVLLKLVIGVSLLVFKGDSLRFFSSQVNRATACTMQFSSSFKTLDQFLSQTEVPALIDFHAQWCTPCQMMQPVLEDLANLFEGRIRIATVDTDKAPVLSSKYKIEALPTLLLFHNGKVLERLVGFKSTEELEKVLNDSLNHLTSVI